MAAENKWAERFWSVVTLLAAVAGGGACVKVMGGSEQPAPQASPAYRQSAPAPAPAGPPPKSACGGPTRW